MANKRLMNQEQIEESLLKSLFHSFKMNCKRRDIDYSIDFDKFKIISKENCVYCGDIPSSILHSDYVRRKDENGMKKRTRERSYQQVLNYNGIDRVDPRLGYDSPNCAPCCWKCNRSKGIMRVCEFEEWMRKLNSNIQSGMKQSFEIFDKFIDTIEKEKSEDELVVMKRTQQLVLNNYKKGAKIRNLEFEMEEQLFYELIKLNCSYCGEPPSNGIRIPKNHHNLSLGYYSQIYRYSGLDRINSSKGYSIENCLACCKKCNYSKNDLPLQEWFDWILRFSK